MRFQKNGYHYKSHNDYPTQGGSFSSNNQRCSLPNLGESPRALKNTDKVDTTMNEFSSASIDSQDIDVASTAYLFQRVGQTNRRKYRVILSLVSATTLIATSIAVISVAVKKINRKEIGPPPKASLWMDDDTQLNNDGDDDDDDDHSATNSPMQPLFPLPPVLGNLGSSGSSTTTTTSEPPTLAPGQQNNINNEKIDDDDTLTNIDDNDDDGDDATLATIQPTFEPTPKPLTFIEIVRPDPEPSMGPTTGPTNGPTSEPTIGPTNTPTIRPTIHDDDEWVYEEYFPSNSPTKSPSSIPTKSPSDSPTKSPSAQPTSSPTRVPSPRPSRWTPRPSNAPSKAPITSTLAPVITRPPTNEPTSSPTKSVHLIDNSDVNENSNNNNVNWEVTYQPGKLVREEAGLKLSAGLTARVLATKHEPVVYANGEQSTRTFHDRPDAGATFVDTRPGNAGGWVYVSNSEMRDQDPPGGFFNGGVGAFTFDKDGNLLNYDMVLDGSTHNCGGGRTPWNTWVSCEETGPPHGKVWQVDPMGIREPQLMTMGSEGGAWESFAYDITDTTKPRFFVTEDFKRGAVQRFTPDNPDWQEPWNMLHGSGTIEYLVLKPDGSGNGGTYEWSSTRKLGRQSAADYYPNCEGIDSDGEMLFFVSKKLRTLFSLDLRGNTYTVTSTVQGMFDGKPDQIVRILTNTDGEHHNDDILYFTEEGGKDAGIHGRDADGNYFTILEGIDYKKETTGLAFSPNNKVMYLAFQDNGVLFEVRRMDGMAFHAKSLNIKYHALNQ